MFQASIIMLLLTHNYAHRVALENLHSSFQLLMTDHGTPHKVGTPFDLFCNTEEQQKAYM